jgi:hypothetical protein
MSINTLEYAKLFQSTLDKQIEQQATSGWMESNSGQVKYSGGDEVKIPKMTVQGLADYDRDEGYVQGSISLAYQTMTMTQDRGRKFQLDAMDVDETGFIATAGNVMGEFQRLFVIPEIDAYRYSKLASLAIGAGNTRDLTVTKENALDNLLDDLAALEEKIGSAGTNVIVTLSATMIRLLAGTATFQSLTSDTILKQGSLNVKLQAMNDSPLRIVPANRLKTAFLFNDGTTAGQTEGGFSPASGAKDINWLITLQNAPIAVSKTDVTRIFDPMTNQKANAWSIDYRKYHDLWVPDNKLVGLYVNTKPGA